MSAVFAIARHEARRIFVSPLAWSVLAVIQFILGMVFWLTLTQIANTPGMLNETAGVADYIGGSVYGFASILLLLVIPLLTMRMFAEDKKSGSLTLLTSAPASITEIVLGKYLGLCVFFVAVLLLLAAKPLSLAAGTTLDYGRIAAGLLGMWLMMMAFGAAGLFMSTLSKEPVIAAVGGFGLLLVVWLMEALAYGGGMFADVFRHLSLIGHFEKLRRGVFATDDLAYYLLFTLLFLWLAVQRLDLERN